MSKQGQSIPASEVSAANGSRREFLKSAALGGLTFGAGAAGGAIAAGAEAPPEGWPMSQKWFPSRWGDAD